MGWTHVVRSEEGREWEHCRHAQKCEQALKQQKAAAAGIAASSFNSLEGTNHTE